VSFSAQIYCSTDSGTNWAAHESSRQWSGVASSADASKMVAVVYGGGQIYTSGCTPAVGLSCATNKTVNCGTAWTFDPPAASDACSGTNVTLTILSTVTNGVCPRIITRTWMVTDACTNSSTCSQTVTVVDTTPPVLTCATNKTVQCGTAWTFDAPSVLDACSGTNVTLAVLGTVTNGSCPQVLTRSWSATDLCGNTNTCSQTVTVVNTNLPVLVCPKNIVVASCTVTQVFYTVIAADACNSNLAVVCTPPSGSGFSPGTTTTVLCVASNCAGSASCSFTISIQCAANPCIPAPANMVLWLPFDETSGTNSANLVPGGNNGLRVNSPIVTSGFVANSLSFDGASQYVDVPSYTAINFGTNDFSIDAWVRRAAADTGTSARIIVDKRDQSGGVYTGFAFYLIGSPGTLGFDLADGASFNGGTYTRYSSSFAVPNDQQWHHVAITVARGHTNGLLFYLDGVADSVPGNPAVRPGSISSASPLRVGAQSSSVGFLFSGSIDEVELFSRALAPTELAALFNAGSAGKCKCVPAPANMVLWLPFDETSGTNSANLVPGGSNGSQVNGPVVTSGFVANSLSFDGASQYVDVPSYNAINFGTNDFSIDAWVRRAASDTGTSARIIVDKRDQSGGVYTGFAFYLIGGPGTLGFDLADGANYNGGTYTRYTSSFAVPNDQQWHHVAMTVARGNTNGLLFYLDGVADSVPRNPAVRPGSVSSASPLRVGSQSSSVGFLFPGSIDEVELFSRALAPTELAALFHAGSAGKCKGPCAIPLLINCATNKMVPCDSGWKFDLPTATSCCSTNINIISTGFVTNGVCPKSITQSWLITDGCGNSGTCIQMVTMVDTNRPIISCPTNSVVVALNANCQLVIPPCHPPATDNCTPTSQLVYTQSPTNGTVVSAQSATVTVWVTDLCGNSNHCTVTVVGLPMVLPQFTCPTNWLVTNCVVPCVLNSVILQNNNCCPHPLSVQQSPACNTLFGPGITSIAVTVTDCHNLSTTRHIQVQFIGTHSFLSSLYNTAVDSTHALLSSGAVDPHYTLGPVPAGTPSYIAPHAIVSSTIWALPPTLGVSRWIAPNTNSSSDPPGFYTYTNQFILPVGADPTSASISGRWAADNGAKLFVNGGAAPALSIPTPTGFQAWHNFTLNNGFLSYPAVNTLRFVVTNLAPYNSYTGLRVEYTHAVVNCSNCAPPVLTILNLAVHSLPVGSYGVFGVSAAGTPPLSYQWYHNGALLTNNGHDSGVTTSTLAISSLQPNDAGSYTAVVSNPCGAVTNYYSLIVTVPWWWHWGWWNVAQLDHPLAASVGLDLNLVGTSDYGTNFTISAGTTEDFGLPEPGGQIVNVMHVAPLPADTSIQVPLIAPPGSNSVNSYTVIMDLYQPGTSSGTPSTLFQSVRVGLLSTNDPGQASVSLTLDAQNDLHLTGSAGGVPFDAASAAPLPVDTWNRVALVVDDPQDGIGVNVSLYLNGQSVAGLIVPTPIGSEGIAISWLNSNSVPTLLSSMPGSSGLNSEFYVSSIQFHAIALGPEMIAGIGSPDTGPAPANATSVGPQPVLSTTVMGGILSFSWTGSPYTLQETTDLTSGVWVDSAVSFTESQVNGDIHTTAIADPAVEGPQKFYRLLFRP
jgi:Concanavalin A-like lectin/glucanases superfamily/Immunoglobulin domain